jgi:hypothetical protein
MTGGRVRCCGGACRPARANVGLVSAVAKPAWVARKGLRRPSPRRSRRSRQPPRPFFRYYLAKVEVVWLEYQPMLAGYVAEQPDDEPAWRRSGTGS